jgi:membrane associated rhomboid family serine protease
VCAHSLLNSLLEARAGRVPLTFLVQVCLWCSNEVVSQLFAAGGGVSHIAHLAGAIVGTVAGYQLHGDKIRRRAQGAALDWLQKTRSKKL